MKIQDIVNMETLKVRTNSLTPLQREHAHLIDPRFFDGNINTFRTEGVSLSYKPDINLPEELYFMHALMDPVVLEAGNVARFPVRVAQGYVSEKYFEDKWISVGNEALAQELRKYIARHEDRLQQQEQIKILDIGPCGGAMTTLFCLQPLYEAGLLDKTTVSLLDIVPCTLEVTLLGEFGVPQELIDEFGLIHAGTNGEAYKTLLKQGQQFGLKEWYALHPDKKHQFSDVAQRASDENSARGIERVRYCRGDGDVLPESVPEQDFDIVVNGSLFHHLNLLGRQHLAGHLEQAAKPGAFIGVMEMYTRTHKEYLKWFKPHFEGTGVTPIIECPCLNSKELSKYFLNTDFTTFNEKLYRTFVIAGERK